MKWEDVSLQQYAQVYNILIEENIPDDEKVCLITQELFNINVLASPLNEVRDKITTVKNLLNTPIEGNNVVNDVYILNGKRYILTNDLSKITTAQYIDYMNYINSGVDINTYNNFLAIFFVPEGHEYNDGYNLNEVKNNIDNYLSIVDATSIAGFFLRYAKRLLKIFQRFLIAEVLKMKGMKLRDKITMIRKIQKAMDGDYSHY